MITQQEVALFLVAHLDALYSLGSLQQYLYKARDRQPTACGPDPARSPFANCSNFMARHVVLYFIKLPFSQHLVLHTYEKPNCTIIVLYVAFCGFVMNRENQELF